MLSGWLTNAYGLPVRHIPCPHPGLKVGPRRPAAGVMHTTEGSFGSALNEFKSRYAPHFLVGGSEIAQLVPLGYASSALEHPAGTPPTNGIALAQIEVATFSQQRPWLPDPATLDALSRLLAALSPDIPLQRPFPDLMPPLPWGAHFPRRSAGLWGKRGGWFGHVEVPNNSHWDPGALRWSVLLDRAKGHATVPPQPPQPLPSSGKWKHWAYLFKGRWYDDERPA